MNDNDRAYVDHSLDCIADWAQAILDHDSFGAEVYAECIAHQAGLVKRISAGAPSPWHGRNAEGKAQYVALMRACGLPDAAAQP